MGLKEITTLEELIKFLPFLVKVHKENEAISKTQGTVQDFIAKVTNMFGHGAYYFGLKDEAELYYFMIVLRGEKKEDACFWLLYINKTKRTATKNLLHVLKAEMKARGVKHAEWQTTIMTRSYDRWVSKFGAYKFALTYKMEL